MLVLLIPVPADTDIADEAGRVPELDKGAVVGEDGVVALVAGVEDEF